MRIAILSGVFLLMAGLIGCGDEGSKDSAGRDDAAAQSTADDKAKQIALLDQQIALAKKQQAAAADLLKRAEAVWEPFEPIAAEHAGLVEKLKAEKARLSDLRKQMKAIKNENPGRVLTRSQRRRYIPLGSEEFKLKNQVPQTRDAVAALAKQLEGSDAAREALDAARKVFEEAKASHDALVAKKNTLIE